MKKGDKSWNGETGCNEKGDATCSKFFSGIWWSSDSIAASEMKMNENNENKLTRLV